MNTNQLKIFAQKARIILGAGVARQLAYWGFDEKGQIASRPEAVEGGVLFRNVTIDDATVMPKWEALRLAVKQHGFAHVVEEGAYTWFNRIMAIRIMTQNGYETSLLEYGNHSARIPMLLQRARRGQYAFLSAEEQTRLKRVIDDYTKETEAFAILFTGYCRSHPLLKNVFGRLDDYTELLLPIDILHENGFIHFLNSSTHISDEDYKTVELIGWLYQFYISEKKDEVFAQFKKNQKARAEDIPAATQIFTPNWIVKYMVENTVGKLWLHKHPQSAIKANMRYLVETPGGDAAPTGKPLIDEVVRLKLLDPASGSGHILTEGFDLLYQMYLEEYYMPDEAVESILRNNLFGLDIDRRAVQLAQFALLMKAASKYPAILQKNVLPRVYAMPEPVGFSQQEVYDFLGESALPLAGTLTNALELMQQAQNLGSTMQFALTQGERQTIVQRLNDLKNNTHRDADEEALLQKIAPYIEVMAVLTDQYEAIAANPPYMGQSNMNDELKNYINKHYPLSKTDLMTVFMEVIPKLTLPQCRFAMINLPSWLFLSSFEKLREEYIKQYQFDSLIHMGRGIFGIDFGSVAFSIKKTSNNNGVGNYFRLHERNFQHIYYGDIEKLFLYSNGNENYKYDFTQYRGDEGITEIPKEGTESGLKLFYPNIPQSNFSKIPGSPIAYWVSDDFGNAFSNKGIGEEYDARKGLVTLNDKLFVKNWHEVNFELIGFGKRNIADFTESLKRYCPYKNGGGFRRWYGNKMNIITWENDGKEIKDYITEKSGDHYSRQIFNQDKYFLESISWNAISSSKSSFRYHEQGFIFGSAGPCLLNTTSTLFSVDNLTYVLGLLNSKLTDEFIKTLNPTFNFGPTVISKIPYLEFNQSEVEAISNLCISISKHDWDSRETSWDFKTSPLFDALLGDIGMATSQFAHTRFQSKLRDGATLQTAYQAYVELWSILFYRLHANEEELNRLFIDIYGLNDELDPLVPLKDITILQEELESKALEATDQALRQRRRWQMDNGKWVLHEDERVPLPALPFKREVVMQQFVSYAIGCMMGRYRLDRPGLHIAHPNPTSEEVCSYPFNGRDFAIDDDGIVPLMGSNGAFADDAVNRFNAFMEQVWGTEQLTANKNFVEQCLDQDVERYLVKDFWKNHCQTYSRKPIYWLFASAKGAFQVLVYMHRMNKYTAEKIRSKYLLKHLQFLQHEMGLLDKKSGLGKEEQKRLDSLRKQYNECVQYDLLLKDCADRQIDFDLDNGVSQNYKLFAGVVAPIK